MTVRDLITTRSREGMVERCVGRSKRTFAVGHSVLDRPTHRVPMKPTTKPSKTRLISQAARPVATILAVRIGRPREGGRAWGRGAVLPTVGAAGWTPCDPLSGRPQIPQNLA